MQLDNINIDAPLVTVFTLVYYTRPQFVIEAIESIYKQTYVNIEHIIVNDAPDDAENWPSIKKYIYDNNYPSLIIENRTNQGVCKNLNDIVKIARGKYLTGCSDDIFLDDFIKENVKFMEASSPKVAACFGNAFIINENGNEIGNYFKDRINPTDSITFPDIVNGNPICAPSSFIRLDVIKEVGMYNVSYFAEDFQMWLKITAKGYSINNTKLNNVKYRVHDKGLSLFFNKNSLGYKEHFLIVYQYLDLLPKFKTIITKRLIKDTIKVYKLDFKGSFNLIQLLHAKRIYNWKLLMMYFSIKLNYKIK